MPTFLSDALTDALRRAVPLLALQLALTLCEPTFPSSAQAQGAQMQFQPRTQRTQRTQDPRKEATETEAATQASEPDDEIGARATTTREDFERARGVDHATRQRADERGADNAADILESAHGVNVQRTASGSGTPIVRGLTGYQVLMMLDDVRLNDSLTRAGGSATLNLVDPESIREIEVIRGPASVLYGSDALGGVVHVRTAQPGARPDAPTEAGASAYARAASAERAARIQGSARLTSGGFGALVSAGRGGSDQIKRGGGLGPQPFTGHDDWSFASRLELAVTRDHMLGVSQQSGHLFDMPRSDVSRPDDVQTTRALDRDSTVVSYDGRLFDRRVKAHGFLGVTSRSEHRERVRTRDPLRPEISYERDAVLTYHAGLRASGSPHSGAGLELGAESTIEAIDSATQRRDDSGALTSEERGRYVDGSNYQQHALYALYTVGLSLDWTLLVGGRMTLVHASAPRDPLFVTLPTIDALDRTFVGPVGSIGLRHELSEQLSWVVSALGGFRAPNLEDFQAFGGGARGFTVPNQDLRSERSWTLESGIELDSDMWRASVYVFGSALDGLIVRVPTTLMGMTEVDGEPVLTRRNASHGVLLGAEASLLCHLPNGLYAGPSAWATWGETSRPDDAGATVVEPASKVPGPTGTLRVGYRPTQADWFVEAMLTGQLAQRRLSEGDRADLRLCPDPDRCVRVPGFSDLTLRAGLRMQEHLLIALALENTFDAAYRTFGSGVDAPGRNFVVSMRGTL